MTKTLREECKDEWVAAAPRRTDPFFFELSV
jgi:hypothetical protein